MVVVGMFLSLVVVCAMPTGAGARGARVTGVGAVGVSRSWTFSFSWFCKLVLPHPVGRTGGVPASLSLFPLLVEPPVNRNPFVGGASGGSTLGAGVGPLVSPVVCDGIGVAWFRTLSFHDPGFPI